MCQVALQNSVESLLHPKLAQYIAVLRGLYPACGAEKWQRLYSTRDCGATMCHIISLLFFVALVGCSSAAEPTELPTAAITVQLTRTATIAPTDTSTPTLTATPRPTQTPKRTFTKEPTRTPTKPPTKALPTATKPAPTKTRPPVPTATQVQPTATLQPVASCDPSYPDVCIPPPPPDLDCKDIPYKRFRVLPPDPHRFDRDKNGIGCES